jgi:hypothetical protein
MGNYCCTQDNLQTNKDVNMERSYSGYRIVDLTHLLDEKEVLGLKGAQKLRLVIKIQALIRGTLVRKRYRKLIRYRPLT